MSSEEYYNYCQKLLNQDKDYLAWLDVMNQTNNGYKIIEKHTTDCINQQEKT